MNDNISKQSLLQMPEINKQETNIPTKQSLLQMPEINKQEIRSNEITINDLEPKEKDYLENKGIFDQFTKGASEGWGQSEKISKEYINQIPNLKDVSNFVRDGVQGIATGVNKDLNMIPGINIPTIDKDTWGFKIGEGITEAVSLLIPVVGAEAGVAKATGWASKALIENKDVYTALTNEFSKSIITKGARGILGGAMYGLEKAYYDEQNNIKTDYEKSILENAALGLGFTAGIHTAEEYIAPYIKNNFPKFFNDLNKFEAGHELNQDGNIIRPLGNYNENIKAPEVRVDLKLNNPSSIEEVSNKIHSNEFELPDYLKTKLKPLLTNDDLNSIKTEIANSKLSYAGYLDNTLSEKQILKLNDKALKELEKRNKIIQSDNTNIYIQARNEYDINKIVNSVISQTEAKEMSDITNYWNSHTLSVKNELWNLWDQSTNKINNIDAILNSKSLELPIRQLLKGEEIDQDLKKQLDPIANSIKNLTNSMYNMYRSEKIELGYIKGYAGVVNHNMKSIAKGGEPVEEWLKFVKDPNLMETPLSNEEIKEFIKQKTELKLSNEDFYRQYDLYSRRFLFKNAEAEMAYNDRFGNAHTLRQTVENMINTTGTRLGAIRSFGTSQEKVISEIAKKFNDVEGGKYLSSMLFPNSVGYNKTLAQVITAINSSMQLSRAVTSTFKPLYQLGKYGFEDRFNIMARVMQKSSILNGLKSLIPTKTENFVKELARMNPFEKKNLKILLTELKQSNQVANHSAHEFFLPNGGKASNIGSFFEGLTAKINGSHINDKYIRNQAGQSHAFILRDYNKRGEINKLLPNIPQEYIDKFTNNKGFIDPTNYINSIDLKEREYARQVVNSYLDEIEAINPVYTRSNAPISPSSPGALLPIRMMRWVNTVTGRVNFQFLKDFSEAKGLSRIAVGARMVSYAASMTALDEAFEYLDSTIDGKKYKPDEARITRNFFAYGTLGSMYFSAKLSYNTLTGLGKGIYFGTKGLVYDEKYSDDYYKDYKKSTDNFKKASYMFKYFHALIDKFDN